MDRPTGTLRVEPPDALTSFQVYDAGFRPVAAPSGSGAVEMEVPLGTYAVQFHVGDRLEERVVTVAKAGGTETASLEGRVAFTSAAPVRGTATTHAPQEAWVAERSRTEPTAVAGAEGGGHLLVVARELEREAAASPFEGAALVDLDGRPLLDLAEAATFAPEASVAGAHLALAPGAYRLRAAYPGGDRDLVVPVHDAWQTQVFFALDTVSIDGATRRRLDLARASVHLVRPSNGFDPSRREAVDAEAALRVIESGQPAPADLLGRLLTSKFEAPMLGVYGAFLHLRAGAPDVGLLREVRDNLLRLVGPLADVVGLAAAVYLHTGQTADRSALLDLGPAPAPPTLAVSWTALLRASAAHPRVLPTDGWAAGLGRQAFRSYPMQVWRAPAVPVEAPAEIRFEGRLDAGTITSILDRELLDRELLDQAADLGLDAFEALDDPADRDPMSVRLPTGGGPSRRKQSRAGGAKRVRQRARTDPSGRANKARKQLPKAPSSQVTADALDEVRRAVEAATGPGARAEPVFEGLVGLEARVAGWIAYDPDRAAALAEALRSSQTRAARESLGQFVAALQAPRPEAEATIRRLAERL